MQRTYTFNKNKQQSNFVKTNIIWRSKEMAILSNDDYHNLYYHQHYNSRKEKKNKTKKRQRTQQKGGEIIQGVIELQLLSPFASFVSYIPIKKNVTVICSCSSFC